MAPHQQTGPGRAASRVSSPTKASRRSASASCVASTVTMMQEYARVLNRNEAALHNSSPGAAAALAQADCASDTAHARNRLVAAGENDL